MKRPKILKFDLETSLESALIFRLFNKGPIPHRGILEERHIICVCWQWEGEAKVHSHSVYADHPHDDYELVELLRELFEEADYVCAHFGKKFDVPYLRARAAYWDIQLRIPAQLDTKEMSNGINFNNKRLDYLGQFLLGERKIDTDQQLWIDAYNGDQKALDKMVRYCKQDVKLLSRVFKYLRRHTFSGVNMRGFTDTICCRECGGKVKRTERLVLTPRRANAEVQCVKCGLYDKLTKVEDRRLPA